jgi:hypothetical protein
MTNDEHEDLDDEKERRGDGRWNSESSMMNTSGEAFRIGY